MNPGPAGTDAHPRERTPVDVRAIDRALLLAWPLPVLAAHGDKDGRGCVLVIAGSRETAGAAVLAAVAALRAGAGKLVIATAGSIAPWVSLAVPEARVIGMAETPEGAFALQCDDGLAEAAEAADAVLVGPGMVGESGTAAFVASLLTQRGPVPVVLDAVAINALPALQAQQGRPGLLITPHAGEMAHLGGMPKQAVIVEPWKAASRAAQRWNATVALKGASTWVVTPQLETWCHACSNPGLATSGSGDVLAGLTAGFLARGASPAQAACWATAMHAAAGQRAAASVGRLGFLARELAAHVPSALQEFVEPP